MLVSKFEKQLSDQTLKSLLVYVAMLTRPFLVRPSLSSNGRIFFAAIFAHPASKIEKK
jgi:hypothetical protein